jgi:hypothetical protein
VYACLQHLDTEQQDFEKLHENGKFLNSDRELSKYGFRDMMINQIQQFTSRKVASALQSCENEDEMSEQMFALKMLMNNMEMLVRPRHTRASISCMSH